MTKRWFLARLLAAGTAAAALSVGLVLPAHAADETPDALVQRLSSEVLDALRNDKSIKAGDVDKIMVLVDKTIMPNVNFRRMTAAVGLPIAISGGLGFVATGWDAALPRGSLGYVYLPAVLGIALASVSFAPLGARLAHRLPTGVLRRVFAVFLLLVGTRLLLSAISSA